MSNVTTTLLQRYYSVTTTLVQHYYNVNFLGSCNYLICFNVFFEFERHNNVTNKSDNSYSRSQDLNNLQFYYDVTTCTCCKERLDLKYHSSTSQLNTLRKLRCYNI